MKKNQWMTDFYGKDWFEINSISEFDKSLRDVHFEWRVSAQNQDDIIIALENQFKLVETVIEFTSEIEPNDSLTSSCIRAAKNSDIGDILKITEECFINNDSLKTRFKLTDFFSREQCISYYRQSIQNYFHLSDTVSVVATDSEGISAYYMIRKIDHDTYKGVMTGVLPRARGERLHLKMQQVSFNIIGRKVKVINSTQLSNFNTIKSHIRANRSLSAIDHIFYLNR